MALRPRHQPYPPKRGGPSRSRHTESRFVRACQLPSGTVVITAECEQGYYAVPKYRIVWRRNEPYKVLATPPFGTGEPSALGIRDARVVMQFAVGTAWVDNTGHIHIDDSIDQPRRP